MVKAERQIKAAKSPELGLLTVRNTVALQQMPQVLHTLLGKKNIEEIINANAYPAEYRQLKKSRNFVSKEFRRDALWLASSLCNERARLSKFLGMKNEFEKLVLNSDFIAAENLLDEVDKLFGKSIWYIENRISIVEKTKGIEAQQVYASEIYNDQQINYDVRLLTYFFSRRLEPSISFRRLVHDINDVLSRISVPERDREYLGFHILPFQGISNEDHLSYIISKECNSAIIDKYLTLNTVLKHVLADTDFKHLRRDTRLIVKELAHCGDDALIQNLTYLFGENDTVPHRTAEIAGQVLQALDDYSIGAYDESTKKFAAIIATRPDLVELFEAKIKADVYAKNDVVGITFGDRLQRLMREIFIKADTSESAVEELNKNVMSFASHSWVTHILSFLQRDGRKIWREDTHPFTIQSGLSGYLLNPWQSQIFFQLGQEGLLQALFPGKIDISPTLRLQRIQSVVLPEFEQQLAFMDLPEDRKNKYLCIKLIECGQFDRAIPILEGMLTVSHERPVYYDALRYLSHCYIKVGNSIDKCLNLVVGAYLQNASVYMSLPISELAELIEKPDFQNFRGSVSWPILNEILYRHFENVSEDARTYAYEDFLESVPVRRPHQLSDFVDRFDRDALVFFLHKVCVPQVMDMAPGFKDAKAVFEERIKVCQLLGEIDSPNASIYITELKDITERITIKELTRHVEQSKIYVDVSGIRLKLGRSLEETYKRYIHLKTNPKLEMPLDFLDQILKNWDQNVATNILRASRRESIYIMHMMIEDIKKLFISSSEFGLVFYLSTRIRHGTLWGQLRSTLDAHNLVTVENSKDKDTKAKDSKAKVYKDNAYWHTKFLNSSKEPALQSLLKTFSKNFDELILNVNTNWLQIKSPEKPDGLFNYDYAAVGTYYSNVVRKVTETTTYEEFLDIVFDELWSITEENLSQIRQRLKYELEPQIIALLNKLRGDFAATFVNETDHGLQHVITNAITSMQNSMERVIEWFHVAKLQETPDAKIETALVVGLASINSYFPHHPLVPSIEVVPANEIIIKGRFFSLFSDIFFILFQNIKAHSGFDDRAPVVNIKISKEGRKICMIFSNELEEDRDHGEIEKKVATALAKLQKQGISEEVQKEGGSGFPKLFKIFTMNLKCNPVISPEVTKGKFLLRIEFDGEGATYENPHC